jgi:hypothetical protein
MKASLELEEEESIAYLCCPFKKGIFPFTKLEIRVPSLIKSSRRSKDQGAKGESHQNPMYEILM